MIQFSNVYKSYKNKTVLININFTVHSGEFLVLVGSSGCGKTTMLKLVNKLHSMDSGDVSIDGTSIAAIGDSALRRRIGYVVQDGGLSHT